MKLQDNGGEKMNTDPPRRLKLRRIRLLWIGMATYSLILLNSVRYLHSFAYQILLIGALINGGILLTFILELRKAYRKLHDKKD